MNIKQIKTAISQFHAADVSVIKDDAMRAKAQKLQAKQGGFTLLELLVVITLLATLAVGALVAYENVGDNAEAVAAANAAATIDSAIRTYRAVEKSYPNQWDSPVEDVTGDAINFIAEPTKTFISAWSNADASAALVSADIVEALDGVGIEEIQYINGTSAGTASPDVPSLAHNESNSYGAAFEVELEDGQFPSHWSVVPNDNCSGYLNNYPNAAFVGGAITNNSIQNAIGDVLEGDECHLVIALGFGSDAASSTTFSDVAISQSPTYVKTDSSTALAVNPQEDYARFYGLFHIGEVEDTDGTAGIGAGDTWEPNDKARLIAIVAPDGKRVDELVSDMQP